MRRRIGTPATVVLMTHVLVILDDDIVLVRREVHDGIVLVPRFGELLADGLGQLLLLALLVVAAVTHRL